VHPATALLGLGLVAVTLVMGAAVLALRADVAHLQAHLSAQNPGTRQEVSCAALRHVRLRGHDARYVTR
jgi:hypothetical protein